MNIPELYNLSNKLNSLAVQSYLKNTGWEKIKSKREHVALFIKSSKGDVLEIQLPLSRCFNDYSQALFSALEILSFSENRETEQVLSDLLLPPSDVIRFRVVNQDTEAGTISFEDGCNLLQSVRKSLYTIACDVIKPELYHKRLGFKEANQFIGQCRLGQTERGSFITSIICPFVNGTIDDKPKQLSLWANAEELNQSFTRKVTTRLMKSLKIVKEVIENDEISRLINGETDVMISANFLESIVEVDQFIGAGELEVISTWASVSPVEASIPNKISINKEYIPAMESIIEKLTPNNEGDSGEFVGKISQVKAEPDASKRKEGEVTINFIGDNEMAIKAKIILTAEDYKKACEAHEFGKNVVVKGTLKNIGRSKFIENPEFKSL